MHFNEVDFKINEPIQIPANKPSITTYGLAFLGGIAGTVEIAVGTAKIFGYKRLDSLIPTTFPINIILIGSGLLLLIKTVAIAILMKNQNNWTIESLKTYLKSFMDDGTYADIQGKKTKTEHEFMKHFDPKFIQNVRLVLEEDLTDEEDLADDDDSIDSSSFENLSINELQGIINTEKEKYQKARFQLECLLTKYNQSLIGSDIYSLMNQMKTVIREMQDITNRAAAAYYTKSDKKMQQHISSELKSNTDTNEQNSIRTTFENVLKSRNNKTTLEQLIKLNFSGKVQTSTDDDIEDECEWQGTEEQLRDDLTQLILLVADYDKAVEKNVRESIMGEMIDLLVNIKTCSNVIATYEELVKQGKITIEFVDVDGHKERVIKKKITDSSVSTKTVVKTPVNKTENLDDTKKTPVKTNGAKVNKLISKFEKFENNTSEFNQSKTYLKHTTSGKSIKKGSSINLKGSNIKSDGSVIITKEKNKKTRNDSNNNSVIKK